MSNTSSRLSLQRLPPAAREKARAFLETAHEFHLGDLPTEQAHPKTRNLSQLAKADQGAALDVFREVELDAYAKLRSRGEDLDRLTTAIRETLRSGGKIFLSGCGATGRLSLSIESLWRTLTKGNAALDDRVIAFMAGGDYALVRSIESFEDHPEYGERQLLELGFRAGDLLLAVTEGGETPFVIGTAEAAARLAAGGRKPWFLYCNPDEALERCAERSRRVLKNTSIEKLNLSVGPMAITGSTRLQATSVLMFAAGASLFFAAGLGRAPREELDGLLAAIQNADLRPLIPLIEAETDAYARGDCCLHVSREHAMTVFTDVTERSPTFSLPAFENTAAGGDQVPAWTYLEVPGARSPGEAWRKILAREPRTLEWDGFAATYGSASLKGFDFSEGVAARRASYLGAKRQLRYEILGAGEEIEFRFEDEVARFARGPSLLAEHLLVKLLLNSVSTLVMGRLDRYEGNVMLWVKSSNNKLIDRSVRYIQNLLASSGARVPPYNEIVLELFFVLETLAPGEPAVLKTRDRLAGLATKG